MPYVRVFSNIAKSSINIASVTKTLSHRSAKLLGTPDDSKQTVQLSLDTVTCFAGSDEPAAFVSVHSVSSFEAEKNKQLSHEFTQSVSELLNVPSTRVFINFVKVPVSHWGMHSTTVAHLRASSL